MKIKRLAWIVAALLATSPTSAVRACNVPVFRYALERWKPDTYEAILFHEGPPTAAIDGLVRQLQAAGSHGRPLSNLRVTSVDLRQPMDDAVRAVWESQSAARAPWLVVRYPAALQLETTLWSGPADRDSIDRLLRSPMREELARRLLEGASTVWLVIETGDPRRDQPVVDALEGHLRELAGSLQLPDAKVQPGGVLQLPPGEEEGLLSPVPLRIEFPVLRLNRADPAEHAFLATILHTDEGLTAADEVIVVPVFGRGRALQAFPGEQLELEALRGVEEFLCGACSCSVKSQNPGMDLLLTADWDVALGIHESGEATEVAVQTLVPVPPGQTLAVSAPPPSAPRDDAQESLSAAWLVLAGGGLAFAVLGGGAWWTRRRFSAAASQDRPFSEEPKRHESMD
ncbi:MAG: hypothetical protein AB7O38_01370 [Pirellulaceae bacterium]